MMIQKRVLVIDDDDDYRASLREVLESEGYEVIEADSGKIGLKKLVEYKPDAIVLDVMMESLEEGYGVNQAIKYQEAYEEFRGVPILMVSSIVETPQERYPRAEEVEMIAPNRYFTKPLEMSRFLEALRRAVRRDSR